MQDYACIFLFGVISLKRSLDKLTPVGKFISRCQAIVWLLIEPLKPRGRLKTRRIKIYVSYFNETTSRSRRTFWSPNKKMES